MASWGETGASMGSRERQHRCMGCGVHIESAFVSGMVPRCGRCLDKDRPVDPVMRWIWYGDSSRR